MKLCPGEAAGSGCTDGSSVLWSSPCTLWWPESSQELRDHPAPLAGVAPPPRLVTALLQRGAPGRWLHPSHPGCSEFSPLLGLSVSATQGTERGLGPGLGAAPLLAGG